MCFNPRSKWEESALILVTGDLILKIYSKFWHVSHFIERHFIDRTLHRYEFSWTNNILNDYGKSFPFYKLIFLIMKRPIYEMNSSIKYKIYEMSYLWNVLSMKCPIYEMNSSMEYKIYEMSYHEINSLMKCQINELLQLLFYITF